MPNNKSTKIIREGLTFDDVLVVPAYSEVLPREADTTTKLTKKITLNIPLVSAAMDTVTESDMAIAMAREGGIGIIHKNMTIEQQSKEVSRVKRADSGMIMNPITLSKNDTIADALHLMKDNSIGGIPIVDSNKKLIGIVTNRDLRFEKDMNKKLSEVMTKDNLLTGKEGTSLTQARSILQEHRIEKLPIVNKQYKLVGLITFKDIQKVISYPKACKDEFGRLRVGAAIGVTADTLDRVKALVDAGVDVVALDTAHGHSKGVIGELKKIKKKYPNLQVICGNIATGAAAKDLVKAGADAVKVGVGPGSICTTRIIAGIGMPQLSAIIDVAEAIKGSGVPIIADGGVRYSGDLVKAIVAGADTMMAGGIYAGTEETPGETTLYEGRKVKTYRGMGSIEAMKQGSKDRYFQDAEEEIAKLVPEGIVGHVPYKGKVSEVIYQFVGGLKAGMGYCGAKTINDLKKSSFVKITGSGIRESHPHDVKITKEAPNYSR
ncbi:MAG: IMP dehydrogenase [Bacteroidetes bacterium]|nr:IMP dehydrogenase [Bacteroidota bacterium]